MKDIMKLTENNFKISILNIMSMLRELKESINIMSKQKVRY